MRSRARVSREVRDGVQDGDWVSWSVLGSGERPAGGESLHQRLTNLRHLQTPWEKIFASIRPGSCADRAAVDCRAVICVQLESRCNQEAVACDA